MKYYIFLFLVSFFMYTPYSYAQVSDKADIIKAAQLAYNQKDYKAAEKLYLDLLSSISDSHVELDSTKANCLLWLGQTYAQMHEYRKAIDKCWKAEEIYEKKGDSTSKKMCVSCYNNIGYCYSKLAELEADDYARDSLYEKSIGFYNQALEIYSLEGNKKDLGASFFNIGGALYNMGEYSEAINDYFDKCENLFKESGVDPEELSKVYSAKASAYFQLGKKNAQTALETLMKKYPASDPACRRAQQDLNRFK